MEVQVKNLENGQELRIFQHTFKENGISLNETFGVKESSGVMMLARPFEHKTLEERAAAFDGNLNLDGEFDFGERVGRETWE